VSFFGSAACVVAVFAAFFVAFFVVFFAIAVSFPTCLAGAWRRACPARETRAADRGG
jgi:hypothetical protein